MEPITGNPELMLRFYQDALYLISLVMSIAALGCGCVYALFVFTECFAGPHRRIKVVPRTAPRPALAELKTASSQSFQLPLVSQPLLRAPGTADRIGHRTPAGARTAPGSTFRVHGDLLV